VSLLLPQPRGIPAPRPSLHTEAYWNGCQNHRLLYQRCTSCGYHGLGPFTVCARCHAEAATWVASTGTGRLYSWTVVWQPPDPRFQVPYAPAVVRLDEGPFVMSAVIGCEPDALHEELELTVEFHQVSDDITLPYFSPASGAA
jgi:uncharacterized protein